MRTTVLLLLITMLTVPARARNRMLTTEFEVNAPIEKVWDAWTTPEGIKTFFAPECKVDLRVDGAYEIYFFPKAKPGERGGEGLRILGLEPMRRFAFTWGAPPTIPYVRGQRTMVILEFEKKGTGRTLVRLTHLGWGEGASWDEAYEYFDSCLERSRAAALPLLDGSGTCELGRDTQAAAGCANAEGQLHSTLSTTGHTVCSG
jgi:uncharacterized protein YndB with AHSA1/START domain